MLRGRAAHCVASSFCRTSSSRLVGCAVEDAGRRKAPRNFSRRRGLEADEPSGQRTLLAVAASLDGAAPVTPRSGQRWTMQRARSWR